jgi:hypothetical protein
VKKVNPKLLKVMRLQAAAIIVNSIIAAVVSYLLGTSLLPSAGILMAVLFMIVFSWLFVRVLNFVSLIAIQFFMYGTRMDRLLDDIKVMNEAAEEKPAPQPDPEIPKKVVVKIVKVPAEPIGKFMDTSFFEWVIIDDGINGPRKFTFSGTTQMKEGSAAGTLVEPGTIVFYPGLIYQVEPK